MGSSVFSLPRKREKELLEDIALAMNGLSIDVCFIALKSLLRAFDNGSLLRSPQ